MNKSGKSGKDEGKGPDKNRIVMIAAAALLLAFGVAISVGMNQTQQKNAAGGQGAESTLTSQKLESGRPDGQTKEPDEQTRKQDEQTKEPDEQTRKQDEQMQKSDEQTQKQDEQMQKSDEQMQKADGQTKKLDGQIQKPESAVDYPARSFTNLCAYNGRVYCGTHGFFGEEIPLQSNIFTIWEEKIYFVEKVQEAYDSLTDELMEIKRSNMDGSDVEVLAEDVFLAGAGYEKLIGDKLFYGYAYDESHCMRYAWVDVNTKERGTISTNRIENVLGYDGTYLFYRGNDREKEQNVLGRVQLETDEDEVLVTFAEVDEEGYIENAVYADGRLYCFTLTHKPEGYDYRTFLYRMEIRDGSTGEVIDELPVDFTGSANYSFLIQEGKVYTAMAGEIVEITMADGEMRPIAHMEEGEYWGILYFVPGDGYLYYEAIAETDEETGNNDYFYRVPVQGGKKELLSEWYTA